VNKARIHEYKKDIGESLWESLCMFGRIKGIATGINEIVSRPINNQVDYYINRL